MPQVQKTPLSGFSMAYFATVRLFAFWPLSIKCLPALVVP